MHQMGYESIHHCIKTIILCDRHKKVEQCSSGLDFKLVRLIFNKYNSKLMKQLFEDSSYVFLFALYIKNQGKKDSEVDENGDTDKIQKAMNNLMDRGLKYVTDEQTRSLISDMLHS